MKNDKTKILFLFIGAFILMIISAVFLIFSYKDSKKEITTPDERIENIDLTNYENSEAVENIIKHNLDNKGGSRGCKLLSKYSEDYVSVMQWMLVTVCDKMNQDGFIIIEYEQIGDDIENVEEIEINGLEQYGSAENYITEYFNNNPDMDISDLLLTYCPDEYYDLKNTYLLGKESSKEYDEASSQSLYTKLLQKYCEGDYTSILSNIEELMETYKFTMPYNYPICNLYQDAKASIKYEESDTSAYLYGLDYMHSVETYLSNFLKLTHSEKINFVLDDTSVMPFAYTHGIITSVKDVETMERNNIKNKYQSKLNENSEIKKISFYIGDTQNEEDTYDAIIICNNRQRQFHIVSLKSTGEKTVYKTAYEIRGTNITVVPTEGESDNDENNEFRREPLSEEILNEVPEFKSEEVEDDSNYDYEDDYDYDNDDYDEDETNNENIDYYEDGDTIISEEYID